jgi:hypothetical protein
VNVGGRHPQVRGLHRTETEPRWNENIEPYSGDLGPGTAAQKIERLIQAEFVWSARKPNIYRTGYLFLPRTEYGPVLDALALLSPEDRAGLLDRLKAVPAPRVPEDAPYRAARVVQAELNRGLYDLLGLGLMDPTAWTEYIDRHLAKGGITFGIVDHLLPLLEQLPEPLREVVLQHAASQRGRFTTGATIEGKRLLDRLFNHLFRGDRLMLEALAEGASGKEAFERYFAALSSYYHPDYRAEDVVSVARALQGWLEANAQGGPPGPVIAFGGSFVNGRAGAESDLDLRVPFPWATTFQERGEAELKALLVSTLRFENHEHMDPSYYGRLQPLTLRIRRDGISLIISKPADSSGPDLLSTAEREVPFD